LTVAKVIIRNLDPEDIRTVFELGLAAFDWPSESVFWSEQVVRWYCESARVVSFVAESDQMIVGFILCFAADSTGCVGWIAVDERFRQQGIASKLIHRALLVFRALGITKITTLAREDGRANRFFQRFGFHDCRLRKVELLLDPVALSQGTRDSLLSGTLASEGTHMQQTIPEYDILAEVYDVWAAADPVCTPSHDFYVQLCSETEGIIVELGVGTGRIAVDVARRNKPIIGVDISLSMLEQCRSRAVEAGVQDHIELIQCDVRSFTLPQKAHLIVFPFRSIGHLLSLEDKKQTLQRIFDQLTPGGRFVFDHYAFSEQWARSHDGIPRLMHGQLSADRGGLFIWDTYRYDFAAQQMNCFITIEKSDKQGRVLEKTHCPLSFSWILPEQVQRLALEVGFEVEALYGDFSYTNFGASSLDQVWFLRRPT